MIGGEKMANKIEYWKLTDMQKKLFRKKLIENKISVLDLPVEPHETEDGCYHLSCAQKEIFPFAQDEEEAAAYVMCNAIRIYKNINLTLLEQAMQFLTKKYEVMRIHFVEKDGTFFQKVLDKLQVKIAVIDLQDELPEEREQKMLEQLTKEGRIPFSVFDSPFFRLSLYRISPEECVLGINIHHFITDGISLQMITTDLLKTYADIEEGKKVTFTIPPVKFTDYALWQNEWIQPDMLQPEIAFWKDALKGIKACYSLPEDFKRPAVLSFDGGFYASQTQQELTARIRACAAANRVSVFQFMLTVYMILVSRYLMDSDVALSTPVSGRLRKETQHIAGFFAQGMVIRTFIEEEKTFTEVLKKTASDIDQAFNNQIVPVDLIGEALDEQESENIGNIFDMFFTFHNYQKNYQESDFRIPFTPVDFGNHMAKGDLSFELRERNDHIDITVEYNLALYRIETIQAFVGHYVSMLENCLDSPSKPLKEIGIEKEEALYAIYEEFNQTGRTYDYHKNLYSIIEEQAELTPERVALLAEGQSFTYEELLCEVEKLYEYILEKGIMKGAHIGIRLESSKELLISLLAVLKAGCTYVPLDPGLPEKRARYIQKKAGMTAVLQDEKEDSDTQDKICPAYYVGKEAEFWKKNLLTTQRAQIIPEDDVYIMFTSGSTGNPKGVQISHENAVNFLLSMKEELDFQEGQSILSVTTYAFDISVLELFLPLVCGGKVILATGQISADPVRLKQMVKEHHPDYVQATPALWQTLFANEFEGASTITALCGGEALNKDLAKVMNHVCKKVFNMYGPTETTVWSLMYQLKGEEPEVYIGKPVGNTTVYILDSNNKLVPPGVRGRLYIGGAGVSKGYLNNPDETDKRFIDNPFGDGRLFYTGDIAKCHGDGTYEYCGRDDQQVKIRGYRIETKEIELCLKRQEMIENCAVVAANGCSGAKVLAAYIQLAKGVTEKPAIQELRNLIREELPEYMVPSVFVFLEKIPVTYNLKIDRKKLMELKIEEESEVTYEVPQNRMQKMLAAIWEQAMQKDRIGIKDDFYCIGGHSLSMIKIKELVYKKTGFSMPLSWVSKYPTIERMAEQLQLSERNEFVREEEAVKKEVVAVADKEHLYDSFDLTQVQTAYWVGRYSKSGLGGISTHIYRETTVKDLQTEKFEEAVNMVIARHDMLRAIILEDGKQQIQKTVPHFAVKRYCFTQSSSEEADEGLQQVRDELEKQVFDPDKWPMFDVRLSQMPDGVSRIHMSFDCLIGDARSFQIILKELAVCYAGRQDELKNLEYSFRDYVITSKQLMNGEAYQKAKKYWMDKLPLIPDKPLLPQRCNKASIHKPTFARKSLRLDREQYQKLKDMAEQNHVTKTVVLLTAFSEILALYSKKSEFTLNLTLFDRDIIHPDIPDLVGDFTTGTLLEIDMTGNETPQTYAKRIQEKLMDNLEHRQFSSVDITRELLNLGHISESYPVVFTSMLDVYEEEHTFEESLMAVDDEESLSHNISQTPQVWLDHQAMEWDGNLYINWDYVEDLFEEQVISTMFYDYQKLLSELLHEETWVKKEPLAQDILKYPYGLELMPALEFSEEEALDELMITGFLEQVRKNGTITAIITKDRIITYEALNQISDSIALHILKQENSSECIGIVMEKGWEQIAAALAILKAGKAYVPIDADLPEKRIEYLTCTCDLSMCLTTDQFADMVDKFTQPFILSDELFTKVVTLEEKEALDKARMQISSLDKAYIIFTSGSTGEPKGVVISNKGAMNTIHDINRRFAVSEKDRVLALSSMSFDLSVYDVFGMLCAGGAIVIPEKERKKDPSYWNYLLEQYGITIWNSVPAFMNIYTEMEEEKQKGLKNLRLILLSGDWIPVELPEKIWRQNQNVELISLGGATECSIWSIWHPVTEVKLGLISIPYGKSLSRQQVYVLNEKKMVCPVGVEGDIYIGGTGLAIGYLKDKEKTREKFISHPLTGKRLYDTGDAGRYAEDGSIIFLGRRDGQVKMNGHRVECGEIQAIIKRYHRVEDAVVAPSKKDKNVLLAYVKESRKPIQEEGLILNAVERKIFKLKQNNIRKDIESKEIVLENPYKEADYFTRKSYRQYLKQDIPFASLSAMLSVLSGHQADGMLLPKYQYASAGSLYPVQLYLYIKENRVEQLEGGYYYYNPVHNSLQLLSKEQDNQTPYHVQQSKPIEESSAFSIYLVADMDAINPLYEAENARLYSILEAGMMTTLLEQEGLKNQIGFCQIGVLKFDKIRAKLRLSANHEYVHMLTGGMVSKEMVSQSQVLAHVQLQQEVTVSDEKIEQPQDIHQLKAYLRDNLPDYMIPQRILLVDEIPLTPNGKVDYKLLASMEGEWSKQEESNTSPEENAHISQEEASVLEIWKQVLEREQIGLKDNFFDIGGTSIKIVQMYKILNQRFEQDFDVITLFQNPTVKAFAAFIKKPEKVNKTLGKATKRGEKRLDRQRTRNTRKE